MVAKTVIKIHMKAPCFEFRTATNQKYPPMGTGNAFIRTIFKTKNEKDTSLPHMYICAGFFRTAGL